MKRFTLKLTALLLAAIILSAMITTAFATTVVATHIGIVKARGGLRLREDATTSSDIIDTAYYGDSVVVLEKKGDWYKVNYNLQIGYMSGEYLTLKERENVELGIGKVNEPVVNMRSGPSTTKDRVEKLTNGDKVQIFGFNCGWFKVRTKSENIGYIRSDLLTLTEKPYENHGGSTGSGSGNKPSTVPTKTQGEKLVDLALTFLGVPYVYGGSSPSGFDCSGFTQYCARQVGITIKRTATAQLSNGTKVSRDQLKPGDLVFFGYGNTATHVGIYIGDNKFVHAENYGTGVVITPLPKNYYADRYLTARRITN